MQIFEIRPFLRLYRGGRALRGLPFGLYWVLRLGKDYRCNSVPRLAAILAQKTKRRQQRLLTYRN
jgi:hypothetical protein